MYAQKYRKYKSKYIELKGGKSTNVLVLHQITGNPQDYSDLIIKLQQENTVHEHHFEFKSLDDFQFDVIAANLYNRYRHLSNLLIVCIEHASPIGLYFVNQYPDLCTSIICYPLRLYSKESLERRIWKFKERDGWNKYISNRWNVDDYYLGINEERFEELVAANLKGDEESKIANEIIYLLFDRYLQLQHDKIPYVFRIPTYLFSRLDLDSDSIINLNYDRKEIADMKAIVSENDALYNSMMWNFHRVKLDKGILEKNKDQDGFLRIHYIIAGIQDHNVVLDAMKVIEGNTRFGSV
jgi:hypothetical protein